METEYLGMILKGLVKNPDNIYLEKRNDDKGIFIKISVDSTDMGRIIGKGGATAKILRDLMHIYGSMNGQNISFKILEPR